MRLTYGDKEVRCGEHLLAYRDSRPRWFVAPGLRDPWAKCVREAIFSLDGLPQARTLAVKIEIRCDEDGVSLESLAEQG